MNGSDISRLVQVACMLLAARYQNATPYKFSTFRKAAYLDCREKEFEEAISYLKSTNFLEIQEVPDDRSILLQSASNAIAKCPPSRGEESREDIQSSSSTTLNGHDNPTLRPEPIAIVFEHWRVAHGHPKAVLDKKRKRTIESALKDYSPESLCESISGYLKSTFHMGENPDKKIHDEITLLIRDSEHIERGLQFGQSQKVTKWE